MTAVVEVGQIWRSEDGRLWRIVMLDDGGVWVRSPQSPKQASMRVLLAWFDPRCDGSWERTS